MKKEIYTITDQNNQKGTDTWVDTNWGIFTKNHGIDHDSLEKEVDYCPGCNVAYCHGRYTTGQCE